MTCPVPHTSREIGWLCIGVATGLLVSRMFKKKKHGTSEKALRAPPEVKAEALTEKQVLPLVWFYKCFFSVVVLLF